MSETRSASLTRPDGIAVGKMAALQLINSSMGLKKKTQVVILRVIAVSLTLLWQSIR